MQFHKILASVAPDILRVLAQSFPDETPEVHNPSLTMYTIDMI